MHNTIMHNPGLPHWSALKQNLRHLQSTKDYGLRYVRPQSTNHLATLVGWSNSDWGGRELDTRRSFAGFVFCLAGLAVSWHSRNQTAVTLSTIEAEYVVVALAAKEGLWIQMLLEE
eukprot:c26895_g2_i1 orf=261-608(+)